MLKLCNKIKFLEVQSNSIFEQKTINNIYSVPNIFVHIRFPFLGALSLCSLKICVFSDRLVNYNFNELHTTYYNRYWNNWFWSRWPSSLCSLYRRNCTRLYKRNVNIILCDYILYWIIIFLYNRCV